MNNDMRERGRRGGLRTFTLYGRDHMQRIGRKGFRAMVVKYWNGDKDRACARLYQRRYRIDPDRRTEMTRP